MTSVDTDTTATIIGATEYLNPAQTGDRAEMIVGGATTRDVGGVTASDTSTIKGHCTLWTYYTKLHGTRIVCAIIVQWSHIISNN